jgi:hypothetical protein
MKPLAAEDPRTIGEYRLQGRLGQGGMGRVYLGLSPGGRAVAVKVVHPELARDTEFLRRFQREVASARAVSGIYTAPVVATGLDEHPPWLATAFVPGPSLEQMVREHGPLTEAALWPLLGGLVEALEAIHTCGVVHRDLKPANVLLAADGPRLIDFGISRTTEGTGGTMLTAAGVIFGTPGYLSPEHASGKPVGPPADIFALGCVMAYAATGAGPWGEGEAATILYRVVHAEPMLDGMPARLRDLVARCLAKDPAARPSPRELAALASGEPQRAGSAVSFWPAPVAALIGAYHAKLDNMAAAPDAHPAAVLASPAPHGPRGYSGAAQAPQAQPAATPQPQGYAATPQPQGYPAANPRPASAPYPPYYQPPRRPARAPRGLLPANVRRAVRVMYAGAAHALLFYGIAVLTINSIVNTINANLSRTNPNYVPIQLDRVRGAVVAVLVVAGLAQIALWLWMAQANKGGNSWARVTSTAFFGFYTLGTFITLTRPGDGTGFTKLIGIIGWLIGCAAVVLLWQPQSSAFFKRR